MKLFNSLLGVFGMRHPLGLHDLDLLHEPSAIETPAIASADASTPLQPASAGVDGPPVQSGEASTGGHPNEIRALIESSEDILRDQLQEIVTRMSAVVREATAVVELVQQFDPTPVGLARASKVTDINSRRK